MSERPTALWHRYPWLAYLAVFIGVCGHASSEFVAKLISNNSDIAGPEVSVWRFVLGLPFTHNPQYHNKRSSIVYQGVADTHVLHGGIALPE